MARAIVSTMLRGINRLGSVSAKVSIFSSKAFVESAVPMPISTEIAAPVCPATRETVSPALSPAQEPHF
jgi:hypothetical protein